MKISKVIRKLQKLKREIGGDPKVYSGKSKPLTDDDFCVMVMKGVKSGKCSFHVGIKAEAE